jgi:hypothetical protein
MKTTRSRSADLRDNVRAVILGATLGPVAAAACYLAFFALAKLFFT